jgi:TrmH family RNA methyltransferase
MLTSQGVEQGGRISSRRNSEYRRLRRLIGSPRTNDSPVVLEGLRLASEAIRSGWTIVEVLVDEGSAQGREGRALFAPVVPPTSSASGARAAPSVVSMPAALLSSLSDLDASPGLIVLASPPPEKRGAPRRTPLIVVLDALQDPGNVGNILRTAEAAGVSEVWLTEGSADPFAPKVLRASAGSALRLRPERRLSAKEVGARLSERGISLLATATTSGARTIFEAPVAPPIAIAFGSEGHGVSAELLSVADRVVRIPQAERVESLNVAASAAIVLFEVARHAGWLR